MKVTHVSRLRPAKVIGLAKTSDMTPRHRLTKQRFAFPAASPTPSSVVCRGMGSELISGDHFAAPNNSGMAARKIGGAWPLLYARSLQGVHTILGRKTGIEGR